jgi:hypothetical protein
VVVVSQSADAGSRLTNSNNSVNSSDAGISDFQETRDIPTPSERVAEFYESYGDRAHLDLVDADGVALREEFAIEEKEEWTENQPDIPELEAKSAAKGRQTVSVEPVTWGEAVETALSKYEETRRTTVNLERGVPSDPEYAEFSVESETRWFASYQKRYFAQLKAWMRELTGGERPSGGETEGVFENPHIALITRSASAAPRGDHTGPVDHAKAIQEAWEPSYHTLRNTLRSEGYDLGEDWQYERRMEPHSGERGGSVNHCYGHEHTIVVVDGEVSEGDFAPVLEKHVEECDPAGAEAHEVGDAVEVFTPEEVEDIAAYVASYAGIQPTGLLERKVEYIAWAAAMDAGNIRTKSRSDAANHAATADACKQRYESDQADQSKAHGEKVVRSVRRGYEFECACCGSPHEIDQSHDTLTSARLSADESGETAVADGGRDYEARRRNELRDRWQDARAAASVGETQTRKEQRGRVEVYLENHPTASIEDVLQDLNSVLPSSIEAARQLVEEVVAGVDRSEPVGFERAPEWRVVSVEIVGQEFPASAGNGVDMVEVDRGGEWRPPHDGSRACQSCGSDGVVSAREAREVYHERVDGAYWCSNCHREFAPIDAPEEPPELRE